MKKKKKKKKKKKNNNNNNSSLSTLENLQMRGWTRLKSKYLGGAKIDYATSNGNGAGIGWLSHARNWLPGLEFRVYST